MVNTSGHLERRKGLVKEFDLPTLPNNAFIRDIHLINNTYVILSSDNKVYALDISGELLNLQFHRYRQTNYDLSRVLDPSTINYKMGINSSSFPSELILEDEASFLTIVGNDIYVYPVNYSQPYRIKIDGDILIVAPFYFKENRDSNILNLIRSFEIDSEDVELDNIFFNTTDRAFIGTSGLDNVVREGVKLFVDSAANLDDNTCKAWLALDPNNAQESTYDNVVDLNKMALGSYIGKPLYFNVLPTNPESIGILTGKQYNVPNNHADTAYVSTLLQNLNTATKISEFGATSEALRINLINELAYARKYCILPYDIEIDSTLTSDSADIGYSNVYPQAAVTNPAQTEFNLNSAGLLSEKIGQEVDLGATDKLFLKPVDISPTDAYTPAGKADTPAENLDVRFRWDRFKVSARTFIRGRRVRAGIEFTIRPPDSPLDNLDDDTYNHDQLESTEGIFLNNVKTDLSAGFSMDFTLYFDPNDEDDADDLVDEIEDDFFDGVRNAQDFINKIAELMGNRDHENDRIVFRVAIAIDNDAWPQNESGRGVDARWNLPSAPGIPDDEGVTVQYDGDPRSDSTRQVSYTNPMQALGDDILRIPFFIQEQTSDALLQLQVDRVEEGIRTLGYNISGDAPLDNHVDSSSQQKTKVGGQVEIDVSGDRKVLNFALPNNPFLDEDEELKSTQGIVLIRDVGADTHQLITYGNDPNLASVYDSFTGLNITVDGTDYVITDTPIRTAQGIYTVLAFTITKTAYEAIAEVVDDDAAIDIEISFKTSSGTYQIDLGSDIDNVDVAFGYSRASSVLLPYFTDAANKQTQPELNVGGVVEGVLQDDGAIQAFGYLRQQNADSVEWRAFVLVLSTDDLANESGFNITFGTNTIAMTKGTISSGLYTIFLGSKLALKPALAEVGAQYSFTITETDGTKFEFSPAIQGRREPKAYAKCLIFELGIPSIAQSGDIRTIGGNDYDVSKNNVADRVLIANTEPYKAASNIGVVTLAARDGRIVRQAIDEEGHSNNILFNLSNTYAPEVRQLKIKSNYDLRSVLSRAGTEVPVEMFKFLTSTINSTKLGENASILQRNPSYSAISDYLGLTEDDVNISEGTILYNRKLLGLDGEELKIQDLITSYANNGVFAVSPKGVYFLSYGNSQVLDFTANLVTRNTPRTKPFVFNNKLVYISTDNTIVNLINSEERRGFQERISGIDQKHLLDNVAEGVFDYDTSNYTFRRSDGRLTSALSVDQEVVGFSFFSFFEDRIRCRKLFNTDEGIKGIYDYDQYDSSTGTLVPKRVIASLSNEARVDFDGDATGDPDRPELLFPSEVFTNPLVFTGVTGFEGLVYQTTGRRVNVLTNGVNDLLVGLADPNSAQSPVFLQYFNFDEDDPEVLVPPPLTFTDDNLAYQSFLVLYQLRKESVGTIFGFQAQGEVHGVR